MNAKDLIIQELEQVPEALLEEVLVFLRFLKTKEMHERLETPILSIRDKLRKLRFCQEGRGKM